MSQLDELRKKAKLIGIDADALLEEIAQVVSQRVQINARELAEEIAASMPRAEVDVSEIVAQLKESLPDTGGPALEVMELKATLKDEIWKDMEAKFEEVAGSLHGKLTEIRQDIQNGMDAAVEAKLMGYKDQIVSAVKSAREQAGAGSGDGQPAHPNDRWGMAIELVERILDRQDPLANIEQLATIHARLSNVFGGGGPDPTTLYRGNQQAFIEGIKVGARAKGGQIPSAPFTLREQGGRSTRPRTSSSKIDRFIENM